MVQSKCPVCSQEYTKGVDESCSRCCYLLTSYSLSLFGHPEVQEREKKRLQSAQEAWKKWCYVYSELKQQLEATNEDNSKLQKQLETANEEISLLKQQLQAASEDNQSSLVEQNLLNMSTNVESDVVTILREMKQNDIEKIKELKQINKNLSFLISQDLSKSETKSENRVNEPDLPNKSDNLNDNDEVFNLVESYNQQVNFPDKIEVSETESSKAQRWTGGRKPAIFETNLTNRGEYWIINNQYLVPKPKQKINEYNYKTLSAFFECDNYEENAADNMTLVKPAQVSLIDGEEKWQLETTGSLQF